MTKLMPTKMNGIWMTYNRPRSSSAELGSDGNAQQRAGRSALFDKLDAHQGTGMGLGTGTYPARCRVRRR